MTPSFNDTKDMNLLRNKGTPRFFHDFLSEDIPNSCFISSSYPLNKSFLLGFIKLNISSYKASILDNVSNISSVLTTFDNIPFLK